MVELLLDSAVAFITSFVQQILTELLFHVSLSAYAEDTPEWKRDKIAVFVKHTFQLWEVDDQHIDLC